MDPFFHTGLSISDSLKTVRKSVLIYETIIKPSETARPTYNEDDYDCAGAPVALTFEYGLVNDFLSEWCEMKTKLNNGEISPNEYFEWKITWPHAMN